MGLRFYELVIISLTLLSFLNRSASAQSQSPEISSYMESILGGFRIPPEIKVIYELRDKNKLLEAQRKATELIGSTSSSFKSTRHEQFIKGNAHYLRAEIFAERGDSEAALEDMKLAADLGHPRAPYQIAARLLIRSSAEEDPSKRRASLEESHTFYLNGAELGDPVCIDHIQAAFRAKKQLEDEHYWFLLGRMNADSETIGREGAAGVSK